MIFKYFENTEKGHVFSFFVWGFSNTFDFVAIQPVALKLARISHLDTLFLVTGSNNLIYAHVLYEF